MAIEGHIHFFDLKSNSTGSWSPNTSKVRSILNYKQIPYIESYISYPDVRALYDHFKLADDESGSNGATLPVIIHYGADGSIIEAVNNEGGDKIVKYLDKIVPERPVIPTLPGYTAAYNAAHVGFFGPALQAGIAHAGKTIAIPLIPAVLDERGKEYFLRTRIKASGTNTSPEKWGSADPEEDWAKLEAGAKPFISVLKASSSAGPFLWGETPIYLDFRLAGFLTWFKRGSEENLKRILGMSEGGELARFWEAMEGWVEGLGEIKEWDMKQMKVVN